jgi:membrane protease YdiL (CAAX protease family)
MNDEFDRADEPSAPESRSEPVFAGAPVVEDVATFDDLAAGGLITTRLPGPGLPESIGWCFGIVMFQLGAGIVAAIIGVVVLIASGAGGNNPQEMMNKLQNLEGTGQLLLFGLPNLFAFAALIGLALLRLGKSPVRKLNFSVPSRTQLLVLCSAVFPIGFVADAVWTAADAVWQPIVENSPLLKQLTDQTNIMEFMEQLEGAPVVLLLLCLAVVPAVGEEFMLRGLVGRGLIARWGLVWGVLLTSALFAMLHMYPVHVAAVFPMGIMMHVIYLTTRSLWAPMLFHFLNNGLASLYTSAGMTGEEGAAPLWLAPIGLAYGIGACCLLWKYRTRYVDADGRPFDPGYITVEQPPAASSFRRAAPESLVVGGLAGLLLVAQMAVIAYDLVVPPPAQNVEHAQPAKAE